MHTVRRGRGSPVVLVHGLGATWQSWEPVLPDLAAHREVVAVDLPGFGATPPQGGEVSVATLADALTTYLTAEGLSGADLVGSSMGGRLVLELARRGVGGNVVALDPGGFWTGRQLRWFQVTLRASIGLVRAVQPVLPALAGSPLGRAVLLAQFSAHPAALSADLVLRELRGYAAAPSMDAAFAALVHGPLQEGAPSGTTPGRVMIGWGRRDRVTLPDQAARAVQLFPDAQLHWFEDCGHFPMWDRPAETVELILRSTR